MDKKIKLGISTCLLGENVRYDGGHKLDRYLRDTVGQFVEWVPVCPEVECGLPTPRESLRLVGDPDNPRLVTTRTDIDETRRMRDWARKKLKALETEELSGFIFKANSPSSGMRSIRVYSEKGIPSRVGVGIFAREFMDRFPHMPVEDDGRLHDDKIRENFIERVFVFRRWQDFLRTDGSLKGLVDFHTDHKLLIMAHSPKHLKELGALVAHGKKKNRTTIFLSYLSTLLEGLKLHANIKKNVNVMYHILGHFKDVLSTDEKQEVIEIIGQYHTGLIPLVVPIVLLQHFIRKYDASYLKRQYYLHPHPVELMLRNHV